MLGLLIGFSSHCNSLYHLLLFFSRMIHPSVTEQCHGKPAQPWRLCQSSTFPLACARLSSGGRWNSNHHPPLGQGGDRVLLGHYSQATFLAGLGLQICHGVSFKRRQKPQCLWPAAELFNLWHNQFFCWAEMAIPSANKGLCSLSAEIIGIPRLQQDAGAAFHCFIWGDSNLQETWLLLLASFQTSSHVRVEIQQMKIH